MAVGLIEWELEVIGCRSLKEKRRVVKSLKDRLRHRFNISVAETGHLELWQRAEITACAVSSDRRGLDSVLEAADRFVAGEARARIIQARRSVM